jgi:acetyl-CoA C-acetyltransferase
MHRTQEAFILSAVRTPIGRLQGALASVPAVQLGATVVRAAVSQAGISNPEDIDEVLIGNVVSAGLGQNIARQCAIRGGLPSSVSATTLNKVCGASLKAAMLASQAIRAEDGDLFVVGGVESMSNAPYLLEGRGNALRYGHAQLKDALVVDGLWCVFEDWAMGEAAEFIADEYEIAREAMDNYALASHRKAIAAIESGKFKDEIIPVQVNGWKGETRIVQEDEAPRRDTSLEALARLRPAFRPEGRVTAGNAPGLNDAASALVIASEEKVQATDSQPLARIVGYTQVATQPKYIFAAPAQAIPRLLSKIGWTLAEVDLIELNEAFAAQILANGYALSEDGWNWEKVNVNGGAIALGHPLGATGARLLVTLVHALRERSLRRGIAALCLGGGEAVAIAIET